MSACVGVLRVLQLCVCDSTRAKEGTQAKVESRATKVKRALVVLMV